MTQSQLTQRRAELKKRKFLLAFDKSGLIAKAAEIAGISRHTVFDWLKKDSDFRNSFKAKAGHV